MDSTFYKKAKERMEKLRKENNQDVTRSYRLKVASPIPQYKPNNDPILDEPEFLPLNPPDVTQQYTLQERIERIKSSVTRINELIQEYKQLSEKK